MIAAGADGSPAPRTIASGFLAELPRVTSTPRMPYATVRAAAVGAARAATFSGPPFERRARDIARPLRGYGLGALSRSAGALARSARTAVRIASAVISTALPTHHWQIALIVNSSR